MLAGGGGVCAVAVEMLRHRVRAAPRQGGGARQRFGEVAVAPPTASPHGKNPPD